MVMIKVPGRFGLESFRPGRFGPIFFFYFIWGGRGGGVSLVGGFFRPWVVSTPSFRPNFNRVE